MSMFVSLEQANKETRLRHDSTTFNSSWVFGLPCWRRRQDKWTSTPRVSAEMCEWTYGVDRRNYTTVPHESHITHSVTLSASTNTDGRLTDLVLKDTMITERQFDPANERMVNDQFESIFSALR